MSVLGLCLNAVIEGEAFVSSDNLFQARVTEGSKRVIVLAPEHHVNTV